MVDVTFAGKVNVDLAGMVSSEVRVVAHGDNDCAQGPPAGEAEGSLEPDGSYVVVVPLPKNETLCAEINISANFPPPPPEPGSILVITESGIIFSPIHVRDIKPVPGLIVAVEDNNTFRITIPRPQLGCPRFQYQEL